MFPVVKKARILCVADPSDTSNKPLYDYRDDDDNVDNVDIVAIGTTVEELKVEEMLLKGDDDVLPPNVLYVSPHPDARKCVSELLPLLASDAAAKGCIEWIHCRSAGIDFVTCDALANFQGGPVTNAKGSFSSTLAEYTML